MRPRRVEVRPGTTGDGQFRMLSRRERLPYGSVDGEQELIAFGVG
jgi:hypothetical protein